MITEELKKLYCTYTGHEPEAIEELPSSGSNRRYFRLTGTPTLIGVSGTSLEENQAFLYMADHFRKKGLPVPQVVAKSDNDAFYLQEDLGDEYVGRYADKTYSIDESEGNVVTLLDRIENELVNGELKPVILSCGPLPMMKAVAAWAAKRGIEAQLSLEQRMGCGYGTCVLCTVDTAEGRLKVCSDGPVFTREQLGWGE